MDTDRTIGPASAQAITTEDRPTPRGTRVWLIGSVLALAGIVMLALGLLMLFVWEVSLFRYTTFDRDFAGLRCGTPLDNPGWHTGAPCHGAVNRQTGAAWSTAVGGLFCLVAAAGLAAAPRRAIAEPSMGAEGTEGPQART